MPLKFLFPLDISTMRGIHVPITGKSSDIYFEIESIGYFTAAFITDVIEFACFGAGGREQGVKGYYTRSNKLTASKQEWN